MTDSGSFLDLSGLSAPVRLRDVQRSDRRRRTPYSRRWWVVAAGLAVYLAAQAAFVAAIVPIGVTDPELRGTVTGAVLMVSGVLAAAWALQAWRNASRVVRIERAARANGLEFDPLPTAVPLVGMVAEQAANTLATDLLRSADPRRPAFTAATIGPGIARAARQGGILVLELDRRTPNIVVVNRRARGRHDLRARFRGDQRLRLEGNFDRTFSLYCPAGYETDALYVFTPDVMARMLDLASDCHAELVDGFLVLTSGRPWSLGTPRGFAALVTLAVDLGGRVRSQTSRYVDDRADAPGEVAAPGRRLRRRVSLGAVLAAAVPAACVVAGGLQIAAGLGLVP